MSGINKGLNKYHLLLLLLFLLLLFQRIILLHWATSRYSDMIIYPNPSHFDQEKNLVCVDLGAHHWRFYIYIYICLDSVEIVRRAMPVPHMLQSHSLQSWTVRLNSAEEGFSPTGKREWWVSTQLPTLYKDLAGETHFSPPSSRVLRQNLHVLGEEGDRKRGR